MMASQVALVDATEAMLGAAIAGDGALSALLEAEVLEGWSGFPESLPRLRDMRAANPTSAWASVLFLLEPSRTLIGIGGYKGEPSADGVVEIGYAIASAVQGRGLATQAARALVVRAFADKQVSAVDAHTLGHVNPSTRVLEKLGFQHIGERSDSGHGPIWHWRLARSAAQTVLSGESLR
jgi:RimJ/RimL family protein N-acetyltransferase